MVMMMKMMKMKMTRWLATFLRVQMLEVERTAVGRSTCGVM